VTDAYPPNHLAPWDYEQEVELSCRWETGESVRTISQAMGRTTGGIAGRLQRMYGYAYDSVPFGWDGRPGRITFPEPDYEDNEPERNSGMERNIAAMMHDDALTVKVKFQHRMSVNNTTVRDPSAAKEYTYVTTQVLAPGDLVVVYAGGALQVAEVTQMDTVLDIEPNASKEYEWIVQKVDTKPYELQQAKNKKLKTLVKEHYKLNARTQMRDLILGQLDGPAKLAALELLK